MQVFNSPVKTFEACGENSAHFILVTSHGATTFIQCTTLKSTLFRQSLLSKMLRWGAHCSHCNNRVNLKTTFRKVLNFLYGGRKKCLRVNVLAPLSVIGAQVAKVAKGEWRRHILLPKFSFFKFHSENNHRVVFMRACILTQSIDYVRLGCVGMFLFGEYSPNSMHNSLNLVIYWPDSVNFHKLVNSE